MEKRSDSKKKRLRRVGRCPSPFCFVRKKEPIVVGFSLNRRPAGIVHAGAGRIMAGSAASGIRNSVTSSTGHPTRTVRSERTTSSSTSSKAIGAAILLLGLVVR